ADARRRFPQARFYEDYRRLLEQDNIQAVVISTPDHTHAPIAAAALRAGKHVYCEKPLAHSVPAVGTLMELAARQRAGTPVGTPAAGSWRSSSRGRSARCAASTSGATPAPTPAGGPRARRPCRGG